MYKCTNPKPHKTEERCRISISKISSFKYSSTRLLAAWQSRSVKFSSKIQNALVLFQILAISYSLLAEHLPAMKTSASPQRVSPCSGSRENPGESSRQCPWWRPLPQLPPSGQREKHGPEDPGSGPKNGLVDVEALWSSLQGEISSLRVIIFASRRFYFNPLLPTVRSTGPWTEQYNYD